VPLACIGESETERGKERITGKEKKKGGGGGEKSAMEKERPGEPSCAERGKNVLRITSRSQKKVSGEGTKNH